MDEMTTRPILIKFRCFQPASGRNAFTSLLRSAIPLWLVILSATTSSIAADSIPAPIVQTIPANINHEFKAELKTEYTLAPPSLFQYDTPGPAEMMNSIAWSIANELVYRTSLGKEYTLPATSSGGTQSGWYEVSFTSKSGKSNLVVEVNSTRRIARITRPAVPARPPDCVIKLKADLNSEDWAVLSKLVKEGMRANDYLTRWKAHPVRVGRLMAVDDNYLYKSKPTRKYSFALAFKDGQLNPHWLEIVVQETKNQASVVDFWEFGW